MRTTPGLPLSVLALVSLVGSVAQAQDVRVHKNAAPSVSADEVAQYDRWSVSGALRDDDRPSILGCIFPTESEAVAYAKQWLASNHAVNPPTAWTHLKFVVVEGEATVRKKAALLQSESDRVFRYPTGDSRVDKLLINLYKSLNKTLAADMRNAIKKKDIAVQDTFKRVMKARDTLVQDVSGLAEDDFKKVNGLVREYNARLDQYSSQEGGEYFSRVPRLAPFSDEMIRQAIAANAPQEPSPPFSPPNDLGNKLGRIWADKDNSYILRIEPNGEFYVINTSSAGAVSAGRWSGTAERFDGRTDFAYVNDDWIATYGIVYSFAGQVSGDKFAGTFSIRYLSETGNASQFDSSHEMSFERRQDEFRRDYWYMTKVK